VNKKTNSKKAVIKKDFTTTKSRSFYFRVYKGS